MKQSFAMLQVLLLTGLVSAQEPLPADKVQNAVRIVTAAVAELKDLQIKLDLNAPKSTGFKRGDDIAVLVIPDRSLTAESLAKTGAELVPVGQLWLRGVVMFGHGEALRRDKLRYVTVRGKESESRLQLYLLGARREGKGLELVVYAKDSKPLLVIPMESIDSTQEFPIELTGKGERDKEDSTALILNVAGKSRATIPIRVAKD
jgi:hypothetical protein